MCQSTCNIPISCGMSVQRMKFVLVNFHYLPQNLIGYQLPLQHPLCDPKINVTFIIYMHMPNNSENMVNIVLICQFLAIELFDKLILSS